MGGLGCFNNNIFCIFGLQVSSKKKEKEKKNASAGRNGVL